MRQRLGKYKPNDPIMPATPHAELVRKRKSRNGGKFYKGSLKVLGDGLTIPMRAINSAMRDCR